MARANGAGHTAAPSATGPSFVTVTAHATTRGRAGASAADLTEAMGLVTRMLDFRST